MKSKCSAFDKVFLKRSDVSTALPVLPMLLADKFLNRVREMICLPDFLVFACLWLSGFSFGYYLKYAYVYDNLWQHWYALLGGLAALMLTVAWSVRKHNKQQYSYDHYYIIFYGLLCLLLSSCFMLSEELAVSFYFSFVGLGVLHIASFSYISLRSDSSGRRPARIAMGNAAQTGGLCSGFVLFNEFEPQRCGFVSLGITLLLLLGVCINELMQYLGVHNYKQSKDLAFNLLNEERLVFLPRKAIYVQFVGRPEYRLLPSRQWLVLLLGGTVVLLQRCCCLYSPAYLQLMWSSTAGFLEHTHLFAPFALYAGGSSVGALVLLRYTPKLVYLMFGIIQVTLIVALLCIFNDQQPEHCFIFLCLIYVTLGVLSSHVMHWLLECSPFLYTELALAIGFAIQLAIMEAYKYETLIDEVWPPILGSSLAALLLTLVSVLLVQWLLPRSASLLDIRNRLLGIRRVQTIAAQTQFWHTNQFMAHNKQPHELEAVHIAKTRIFQQYPTTVNGLNNIIDINKR